MVEDFISLSGREKHNRRINKYQSTLACYDGGKWYKCIGRKLNCGYLTARSTTLRIISNN